MHIIDLRSDTVTRPSKGMLDAMIKAEVGDDVLGDDPTVLELESYVADLFGVEAALFLPSGTMANQIAIKVLSVPETELLCERECHVVNYEVAGPAVHARLLINLLTTERGMITAKMVEENIRPINVHCPLTKTVSLENTHNRHGGTVLPQDEIIKVQKVCKKHNLGLHLDGARIWNAHIATGTSLTDLVKPFDSVSVCLSKGLGAPVGSLILGDQEFRKKCHRQRKLFGGAMRQSGYLAAAGLFALKNNIDGLKNDHQNARFLAEELSQIELFKIDLSRVETNIVIIDIGQGKTAEEIIDSLNSVGIKVVPFGPTRFRMVTHLDVSSEDCKEAVGRIKKLYA